MCTWQDSFSQINKTAAILDLCAKFTSNYLRTQETNVSTPNHHKLCIPMWQTNKNSIFFLYFEGHFDIFNKDGHTNRFRIRHR